MEKKLIYQDEKNRKFWNIKVQDNKYTLTYGKADTAGKTLEKAFYSNEIALAQAEKQIAAKLRKGYEDPSSPSSKKNANIHKTTANIVELLLARLEQTLAEMNISDTERVFFQHKETNKIWSCAIQRLGNRYAYGETKALNSDHIGAIELQYTWKKNNPYARGRHWTEKNNWKEQNSIKKTLSSIKRFCNKVIKKGYVETSYANLLSDGLHLDYQEVSNDSDVTQTIVMQTDYPHYFCIEVYTNKVEGYEGILHQDVVRSIDDALEHPFEFAIYNRIKLFGDTNANLKKLIKHYKSECDCSEISRDIPETVLHARFLFEQQRQTYQEVVNLNLDSIFRDDVKLDNIYGKKTQIYPNSLKKENWVYPDPSNEYEITFVNGDLNVHALLLKKGADIRSSVLMVAGNVYSDFILQNDDLSSIRIAGDLTVTEGLLGLELELLYIENHTIGYEFALEPTIDQIQLSAYVNELIIIDEDGNSCLDAEKLYDHIIQKKVFFKDDFDIGPALENIEKIREDIKEKENHPAVLFEKNMNESEYHAYNIRYAGFEFLYEDKQCDFIFYDRRGKSGAYHAFNSGALSSSIDLKPTKVRGKLSDWGIEKNEKPLELLVSPVELLTRYARLYCLHKQYDSQTVYLGEPEDSTKAYEKEKTIFVDDPYLALYWLNHFGATLDPRFDEVVQLVEENNLVEKLEILKEPLAFFEKTDAFYEKEIVGPSWLNFEDLFLKRRSYLVFYEHSYKNYKPDNLDLWWKSIIIYPKVEENLILRVCWLKNNLHECDIWSKFNELITEENKSIPLLSYVFASDPNTSRKDKKKYADIFTSELFKYKSHFKSSDKRSFGAVMLWDIRAFVSDKETLKKVTHYYFRGKKKDKEYQDIQAVLEV